MTMTSTPRQDTCPTWCVTEHGTFLGEEDCLHTGADLHLVDDLTARLCCSVDPGTGAVDGPYIIVGSDEWTVERTRGMANALFALADAAASQANKMHFLDRGTQQL